jgi:hypothetical protein
VFEALARRGATVTAIVSGDPGCDRQDLVANAVRFTLTLRDGIAREVHVFAFRSTAALASARASLEACRASFDFGSARPGGAVGTVEVGAFHAFGAPWSAEVRDVLEGALGEATRGG